MLHAVPELLATLEAKLLEGEDPTGLLAGIRWSDLVGWPEDADGAQALKMRIIALQTVIMGLQSPLRTALVSLSGSSDYGRNGIPAEVPAYSSRLHEKV